MPMITLTGTLECAPDDRAMVEALLPGHIRLTLAEPGCLLFQVVTDRCNPCRFLVAERFTDRAALDAHTARARASDWGRATAHIPRDFTVTQHPDDPAG